MQTGYACSTCRSSRKPTARTRPWTRSTSRSKRARSRRCSAATARARRRSYRSSPACAVPTRDGSSSAVSTPRPSRAGRGKISGSRRRRRACTRRCRAVTTCGSSPDSPGSAARRCEPQSTSSRNRSGSPTSSIDAPRSYRAANGGVCTPPSHSSATRASYSSTSRRSEPTSRPARNCWKSCATSRAKGPRSCTPRTISQKSRSSTRRS